MQKPAGVYKKVGTYNLLKEIGVGSFARVFRSKCENTGQNFAIKMISKNHLSSENLEMIDKEIEILQDIMLISEALDHPNIIKLIDFKKTQNNWYLIFEYCDHGDLEQYMKKFYTGGKFPEELARRIMIQVARAFKEVRKHNIVHRDLKLANILLNKEFQVKLADFGFAKFVEQDNFLQSYCGTPITMAIEILKRQMYTEKCDIWSLGVIVYQMIFGTPPFSPHKGGGIQDLVEVIETQKLQFPSSVEVSQQVKDLVKRALTIDVKKRMDFDEFFSHPWLADSHEENPNELLESAYQISPRNGPATGGKPESEQFTFKLSAELPKQEDPCFNYNQYLGEVISQKVKRNLESFQSFFLDFKEILKLLYQKELIVLGSVLLLQTSRNVIENSLQVNICNQKHTFEYFSDFKDKFSDQGTYIFKLMQLNFPENKDIFKQGETYGLFVKYLLQYYNQTLSSEMSHKKDEILHNYSLILSMVKLIRKQSQLYVNDRCDVTVDINNFDFQTIMDFKEISGHYLQCYQQDYFYNDLLQIRSKKVTTFPQKMKSQFKVQFGCTYQSKFETLSLNDFNQLENDINIRVNEVKKRQE